jgi:tetratricopeptide (TPR) repeat protein
LTLLALVLAVLIPVATAESAEEAFAAGERAFREDRIVDAEARYREALERDPVHLRALIRLATVVSWDNRLEESIALFERARAIDPGNRQARLGLAKISSWAERYPQAIVIYEKLLGENARDREAALGLARAHAWAGHSDEAQSVYRDLLSREPEDVEARVGLAQILSWDGELDAALDLYDEALEIAPENEEALKGRAQVLLWQGRLPQAWEAVGEALEVNPRDKRSIDLDRSLREGFAPTLTASAGVVHDSDRNAIDTQHAGWSYSPTLRTTLGFAYDRFDASRPRDGAPTFAARLESLIARASWRTGGDLVLSGSAGLERISRRECAELMPPEDCDSTTHATASAAADYRLDDRWSLSGSLLRQTFAATAESLIADVGISAGTVSASFVPLPRVSTRLTLQRANLTDGVQRDLVVGYARWAVPVRRPRVGLSWLGRAYSCDDGEERDGGTGYFCPDSYASSVAGLDITDRIGPRFQWSVQGTLGVQRVHPHGGERSSDTVSGYYVRASYDLGRGISAEAYFGSTNLALAAGSGFDWTESGVRIRWRFDRLARVADRDRTLSEDDGGSSTAGGERQ